MNLEHLQRFLMVIERGSIGGAARELRISKTAVSNSVQYLEATVGVKLFERTEHGMVPNIYGGLLKRRAQTLTLTVEKAVDEIREMLEGFSGRIRVSIAPSLSSTPTLPSALLRFRSSHPKVFIDVVEETRADRFLEQSPRPLSLLRAD